jgi:peptidyl-tRNA hydrolase, PTH1 family
LIVGLGNPGTEYAGTRHNVGFVVVERLAERWQLGRAKDRYRGRLVEGRLPVELWHRAGVVSHSGPSGDVAQRGGVGSQGGGVGSKARDASIEGSSTPTGGLPPADHPRSGQPPRVALLCPQTYMNAAGRSVGPARGALKVPLERVLVIHDEIDLPFGEVRTRVGGGLAGHNGLKSLKRELGSADFARVRVGIGRPASTDPEIVSAYVLGRFREPGVEVDELIDSACRAVEQVVLGIP